MTEYEVEVTVEGGERLRYTVHARSPEEAEALADDLARLYGMGLVH